MAEGGWVGCGDAIRTGAAGPDDYHLAPNPLTAEAVRVFNRLLAKDGLVLPAAFATFIGSARLQHAVPSLGNEWRVTTPFPSPIEKHAYLVRFMHDSQGCLYWYLYLGSDGTGPVLCSPSDHEPEEGEEAGETGLTDFLGETRWVAPDFEQFLYRYWIEHVAWYEVVDQDCEWDALSPVVRGYLDHYRSANPPTLDIWPSPLPPDALRTPDLAHPGQGTLW
ncbi:hypothetical protein [Micromonospora sp. NBC_01796]|uniref:hypothetical protein n=1 Tax=Micromonospora sp. NBC_01796 TaxID=2975987 RepID=UPI002DDBBEA7|nr:hypothetical protein [Micromonospora sp. NBC_01796]WSA85586.1 hypothetical protein OIE47_35440 [Micromonospora sp. NBC_01796]